MAAQTEQTDKHRNPVLPPRDANETDRDGILLWVVRLGAFLCLAGWTWVHLYWEGPYGILLWQDSTYELATRFGISWDEFVGAGAEAGLVQKWLARVGWLYLTCTILTLTVRKGAWLQIAWLLGGSGLLVVLSYSKYVAAQRQLPMFVEHGGQMLMPVVLVLAIVLGVRHRTTVVTAMVAFVMTFAGHGCYALNIWPTPPTFYAMTCVSLHVEYETAEWLIRLAGALDVIVCVGIFIPLLRRFSAMYAMLWGFATAIARPLAGMSWSLYYWGSDQFLHEAVLRAPHFLIPFYLFLVWDKSLTTAQVSDEPSKLTSAPISISNPSS